MGRVHCRFVTRRVIVVIPMGVIMIVTMMILTCETFACMAFIRIKRGRSMRRYRSLRSNPKIACPLNIGVPTVTVSTPQHNAWRLVHGFMLSFRVAGLTPRCFQLGGRSVLRERRWHHLRIDSGESLAHSFACA